MDANLTIDRALHFHRAGDLANAELAYLQILRHNPNHADALHLLGMLCHQTGQTDEAIRLIRRAISIAPNQAVYHSNLGLVLAAVGQSESAIQAYEKATQLDPQSAEALNNLAVALAKTGQMPRAIETLKRAVRLRPDYADAQKNLLSLMGIAGGTARAHHALGDLFQESGQYEPAIDFYRKAISLDGTSAESWNNLGNALFAHGDRQQALASYQNALTIRPDFPQANNNLANVLKEVGRYEEAVTAYQRAIELQPNSPEPLSNLGNLIREAGQWESAVEMYQRALAIDPNHVSTLNNLGNALSEKGRFSDAVVQYEKAVALSPDYSDAINNLGTALEETGQRDRAMECYQRARQLDPDAVSPPWNIALLQLLRGDYENGWKGYENRWRQKKQSRSKRNFSQPMPANVEQMKGKRILLHAEQGFGDVLQFCRYVPLVAEWAGEVIFECPKELRRLFENSFAATLIAQAGRPGIDLRDALSADRSPAFRPGLLRTAVKVVERGEMLPSFDLHCPLMSLPMVFGTTLADVPAQVPYLFPDPADVQRWGSRFADQPPGLRVGLVWAGQSSHQKDRHRSLTLADFDRFAEVQGVRFYSLQVGAASGRAKLTPSPGTPGEGWGEGDFEGQSNLGTPNHPHPNPLPEYRERGPEKMDLVDWTADLHDFADTAALISHLDLVITVDTAVAHLAGAMGKPVWVLLAYQPDWRWLLDRTDSPWYPSARLFRQTEPENWTAPLSTVRHQLAKGELAAI